MLIEFGWKHPIMQSGAVVTLCFTNKYMIFIGFAIFLWLSWQLWEECLRPSTFCVERCIKLFCLVDVSRWPGHSWRSVKKLKYNSRSKNERNEEQKVYKFQYCYYIYTLSCKTLL